MRTDQFTNIIKRILKEEVEKSEKRDAIKSRNPEMNGNGIDPNTENSKCFGWHTNTRDPMSKVKALEELTKLVRDIGDDISVVWDDHDDLMINARDLMSIRITPNWEDNYEAEMFTRNEDRVWVGGLSWEQLKNVVKTNLKDLNKHPTKVEKAYDKSYRNQEDQIPAPDKGLPQKDKPKTLPLTTEKPSETKNKEKNYTEKAVKDDSDDLPNKPMKEVGEFKKLGEYKVKDPVKLRKHKVNTKLVVKQT